MGVMQIEPRMLFQPCLHLGRFVGRVVVEHEVDVAGFSHRPIDAEPDFSTGTKHAGGCGSFTAHNRKGEIITGIRRKPTMIGAFREVFCKKDAFI